MRCAKKIYEIRVKRPAIGTEVYNYLEDCHYTTSEKEPYVLIGTADEEWTIDEVKLLKTYTAVDGTELDLSSVGEKPVTIKTREAGAIQYFCKQVPIDEKVQVATSWGEVLTANRDGIEHGDGDYIVSMDQDFKDSWVVNGVIFGRTYNIIED